MKIFSIQSKNQSVDWVPPTWVKTWTSTYIISAIPTEFHIIDEVKLKILQSTLYHRSSLIV